MKSKFLLFTFIVLSSSVLNAQIKRQRTARRLLNFLTEKNGGSGTTLNTFSITPAVGKAIRENLIIGADLSFSTRVLRNSPTLKINDRGYGAGIFIRKYAPLGKSFYLFGQGRLGGEHFKNESELYPNGPLGYQEGYNLSLSFYPGIAYSISNKLQLEVGLPNFFSMTYSNYDPGNDSRNKSFGVSTSLNNAANLSIGLRVLLNKKAD